MLRENWSRTMISASLPSRCTRHLYSSHCRARMQSVIFLGDEVSEIVIVTPPFCWLNFDKPEIDDLLMVHD